jgi:hypothetical protein
MAPTTRKIPPKVSSSGKSLDSAPFPNAFIHCKAQSSCEDQSLTEKNVHAPPLQGKGTRCLREGFSGLSRRMGMTPWQRTMSYRKR